MDDHQTTPHGRRPSAMAMLAAGTFGAAVLGFGGVAYAQTAALSDPDPTSTEQQCERGAGAEDAGSDTISPAPDPDSSSAEV